MGLGTGGKFLETVPFLFCLLHTRGGLDGKEYTCSAGDLGLIPGSGRSPSEGNGYPLQYSCLENSMAEEPGGLQPMESQRAGHD